MIDRQSDSCGWFPLIGQTWSQFSLQISESVLVSGEHLSRKFRVQNHSPLMYEWYQEQYVGAAHGLAGIYYYLMQVKRVS